MSRRCTCNKPNGVHQIDCTFGPKVDRPEFFGAAVLKREGGKYIDDPVNHPPHYTNHPSGVECIEVTEHMNFCIGNAIKYLWRAGEKGNYVQDLEKAKWYIEREIARYNK